MIDSTTNDDNFDISSQTAPESAVEDDDTKNKLLSLVKN